MTLRVGLLTSTRVLSAGGYVLFVLGEIKRHGLRYHRGLHLGRLSTKSCKTTWGCFAGLGRNAVKSRLISRGQPALSHDDSSSASVVPVNGGYLGPNAYEVDRVCQTATLRRPCGDLCGGALCDGDLSGDLHDHFQTLSVVQPREMWNHDDLREWPVAEAYLCRVQLKKCSQGRNRPQPCGPFL
jgi:hypothetical protein